jgi:hypothetical protein
LPEDAALRHDVGAWRVSNLHGWNAAVRHPIFLSSAEGKKIMFERVKNFISAFHLPTAAELEREYLNGAANRVDLEFRQRQIDRGMFRRFDG